MGTQNRSLFPTPDQVPEAWRLDTPLVQREWLVDGRIETHGGALAKVLSPVCLRRGGAPEPVEVGSYPLLGAAEAEAALAAARRAWADGRGDWPTMPVAARIRAVEDFALRMKARRAEVVKLLMWEIAKPLPDAEKEFDRTIEYIAATVDALKDLDRGSSRFLIHEGIAAQVRRAPLGVALCMGPFNYPLNETFTTLIPALIMGNPVLFKPAKLGVLFWQPLLQAMRESFPPGVVGSVYGEGTVVIPPLMTSGGIDVLAFIGSCKVANILKRQHPRPHRLRSILGLEAKNAAIVLPDADLELAVKECVLGALSYNGQRCTGLKLIWVHRKRIEDFLARFVDEVGKLKAGMPWEPGVKLTPLPEPGKPQWLTGLVEDAVAQGARVVNPGGGSIEATWFQPAVVYPVTAAMRLGREEQFGPVVPIAVYDDVAEPIRFVVEGAYGQQVSLFGNDPDALSDLIDPLVNQVCRVNLNSQCQRGPDVFPFTGRKDSAEGTLSVSDALRAFSIRTMVAAKQGPANHALLTRILTERRSAFLSTDFLF